MLDFFKITVDIVKSTRVIYPTFIVDKTRHLMIRNNAFYAIWDEEAKLWKTSKYDAVRLIDNELQKFTEKYKEKYPEEKVTTKYLKYANNGMIDVFDKYCNKQMPNDFHYLDRNILFMDDETCLEDYASVKLPYKLEDGPTPAWDTLGSELYATEFFKIEWAIGAIVSGDSKSIQKFVGLYGDPGKGKGTILKIIKNMFKGYTSTFSAEALASKSGFPMEEIKDNPLIALNMDGNLSKIESNTIINQVTAHEEMSINLKNKAVTKGSFDSFLFVATNTPILITDSKSGIIRRLIDVNPTNHSIPKKLYNELMEQITFEYGHIAKKCLDIYLDNRDYFDDYIPLYMMRATNPFFNFIEENAIIFAKDNGVSLKSAWNMYCEYCTESNISKDRQMNKTKFKSELRTYFDEFYAERTNINGVWITNYFKGFREDKLHQGHSCLLSKPIEPINHTISDNDINGWLNSMSEDGESKLDIYCKDCAAQYANEDEAPSFTWDKVKTTLKDIDTHRLHYLRVPEYLIVIDFDMKDSNGKKSFELNLREASKWPKTYAEVSKSGGGIHLHYFYYGDVSKLSHLYERDGTVYEDIEIKVFSGKSSLRRKLTKHNNEDISVISSGLPLKEDKKMLTQKTILDEKHLINRIKENLSKKYGSTTVSINYIYNDLEAAYNCGISYDVSSMYDAIYDFAAHSTNQASACIDKVSRMHFKSDELKASEDKSDAPIVFFDMEVFPNLCLLNWKFQDPLMGHYCDENGVQHKLLVQNDVLHPKKNPVYHYINPTKEQVESLFKYRLVGFNNRNYDNHILYAIHLGYTNEELYELSQDIVNGVEHAKFGNAYNLSYTDIYDYTTEKRSLKLWEIKLHIFHMELGLPWNKPVPKEKWELVSKYCDNDVISTEEVWNNTQDDFLARQILADLADMTVNDTTNSLTTKIIFGNERKPVLNYVDLSLEFKGYRFVEEYDEKGKLIRHNFYRDIDLGLGGYVYVLEGMFGNVALLDIASMHPHSAIAMRAFGEYTDVYEDLVEARVDIKHGRYDDAGKRFNGKLAKYTKDAASAKKLSTSLKLPINGVYGLSSASFANPFKHPDNKNNIIALRGALFMKTLQDEVTARGYTVVHIKTDSIKIADADLDIINFCFDFAKKYKYTFEHEATYDRMCIVNKSTYIAKYKGLKGCEELYGKEYVSNPEVLTSNRKKNFEEKWTATGEQFQVPFVFKKLFSKEDIEFYDLCETKTVKDAMYLDYNENYPDVTEFEKVKQLREKVNKPNLKPDSISKKSLSLLEEYKNMSDEELYENILKGHNYSFVGKVGLFCPVKPGCGGGKLLRSSSLDDLGAAKMDAVTGTKNYRWKEATVVQKLNAEDTIDKSYYMTLVNEAIDDINKYGDFNWFVSDEPYVKGMLN